MSNVFKIGIKRRIEQHSYFFIFFLFQSYSSFSMQHVGSVKPSSQYDASQRVRKNRTNFYSSVWVKTGARHNASAEPASSELRVATRHIVN